MLQHPYPSLFRRSRAYIAVWWWYVFTHRWNERSWLLTSRSSWSWVGCVGITRGGCGGLTTYPSGGRAEDVVVLVVMQRSGVHARWCRHTLARCSRRRHARLFHGRPLRPTLPPRTWRDPHHTHTHSACRAPACVVGHPRRSVAGTCCTARRFLSRRRRPRGKVKEVGRKGEGEGARERPQECVKERGVVTAGVGGKCVVNGENGEGEKDLFSIGTTRNTCTWRIE